MRYLRAVRDAGSSFDGKTVLEFGPGSSFGVGTAALLSGCKRYYGFDLIDHTDVESETSWFSTRWSSYFKSALQFR